MTSSGKRTILWTIAAMSVAAALAWAFQPRPIPVDMVEATRGPLVVTADEEAKTRVRDVYVVSAPVGGYVRRTELDVGDVVKKDETVVAEIEPADPAFLDQRARSEAEADLSAAQAALALARAQVEEALAELDFARSELERARRLAKTATISEQAVDDAQRAFRTRTATLATAEASVSVQEYNVERARSRLTSPMTSVAGHGQCECITLSAPVSGKVLEIHHESEGVVASGEPLIALGDASELEIVAEMLSGEAVQVQAGMRVIVEGWGGEQALDAVVRRIEPFGFTKVSALGIEEQRVNVLMDIEGERQQWIALGHGFRVDVRVVLWESDDALTVPLTALFRNGDHFAVFVDDDGIARIRRVEIGRRADLRVIIEDGLEAGERVVVNPGDRIQDGTAIADRNTES